MISRATLSANDGLTQKEGGVGAFGSHGFREILSEGYRGGFEFNAIANCLSDQVSAKQVQIVRSLAADARIDVDELSWYLFDCDFAELSKKAAERLIAYLEMTLVRNRLDLRLAG